MVQQQQQSPQLKQHGQQGIQQQPLFSGGGGCTITVVVGAGTCTTSTRVRSGILCVNSWERLVARNTFQLILDVMSDRSIILVFDIGNLWSSTTRVALLEVLSVDKALSLSRSYLTLSVSRVIYE